MTDIKLNINIVGNPRGIKELTTNRKLSMLSVANGGGTTITADNGIFPTTSNGGKKCFVVGVTPLGDTEYTLTPERGYKGYITRDLVGANGALPTATDGSGGWTMQTSGVGIVYIKFEFDKSAQQYPTQVRVFDNSGAEITNRKSQPDNYTFIYESSTPIYKIEFSAWAKANYPACITNITAVPSEIVFNKHNVASISSATESQSDASTIQYGAIASTGTISVLDIYSEALGNYMLHEYARQGWINKNVTELVLTLNGKKIKSAIAQSAAKYDEGEKQISIPITDKINSFSEMQTPDIALSAVNGNSQPVSLLALLKYLLERYGGLSASQYDLSTEILVGNADTTYEQITVENYLNRFWVPTTNVVLKSDTLANQITKICTVAQLSCYDNADNVLVFVSGRPTATSANVASRFKIPTKLQTSTFTFSLITSNNYTKVAFSDEEVTDIANTDNLYTVQSNELFEANAYYQSSANKARKIVRTNILADYRNGIFSGEIEIMLGTKILDVSGNVVVDFDRGDIIQPQTVLQLYKDLKDNAYITDVDNVPYMWKVTSATFDWSGNPKMKLKVMQILQKAEDLSTLFFTSDQETFVTSDNNILAVRR